MADEKKAEGAKAKEVSNPSLNMDEIRAVAELFDQHALTELEFENENIRVRLSKAAAVPVYSAATSAPPAPMPPASGVGTTAPAAETAVDADAGLHKIVSPIVGTFYRSPGPDKDSYVSEGSRVTPESTVCIVEAMKLMNEIQAEVAGEVVKIYVENGQPVEYGQPLFGVKK